MDGWNYALRFYRPRAAVLDGTWKAPAPAPVDDGNIGASPSTRLEHRPGRRSVE